MSNYQFPPSSPLLDGGHGDELPDPFANITHKKSLLQHQYEERGRYPTPNPSSTTGRSSSPVRDDVEIPVKSSFVDLASKPATAHTAKKNVKFSLNSVAELKNNKPKKISKVRINRDFNILDPDANVLRVPLNLDGTTILVGRSSKSCDYHFNTSDRTISRSHLGITYTKDGKITIECLGFSGFGMRVPKACLVYGTDKANDYILLETSGSQPLSYHDLRELGLAVTPRTISLDSNHTEFFVNRYERVTLPKINNIFIQVRDHVMLLNPVEDEEDVTEDEMPELVPSIVLESAREKEEVAAAAEEEEETEIGNEGKEVVTEEHAQKLPVSSPFESPSPFITSTPVKSQLFSTPIKSTFLSTPLTPAKINIRATSEEPTPSYSLLDDSEIKLQTFSDNEEPPSPMKERLPLKDITSSTNMTGPKLKKKKLNPVYTSEIDQSCIQSISNISEINNVLLNHLAFSRLSSTPASFLNTISALTSNLSLKQMRVILHNLKPVGVIFREGKDAAGKPLEEEYYYKPEDDEDDERPKLVASIKGHGGLRSCRRTHKQYYWKKPAPKKK